MKTKQWDIVLDNNAYEIKISHGTILRRYTITVNGAAVNIIDNTLIEGGNRLLFHIGKHLCAIIITYKNDFSYDFVIDGIPIDTKKTTTLPEEWEPTEDSYFSSIKDWIMNVVIIGIMATIGWFFTGNFDFKKTERIIDFVVIGTVIFALIKSRFH